MSEVKRYFTECGWGCAHSSYADPNGEWVDYNDHAAEVARLKAEVERLTIQRAKLIESAEELFRFVGQELYGPIDHFEAAWEAAKEGKQP